MSERDQEILRNSGISVSLAAEAIGVARQNLNRSVLSKRDVLSDLFLRRLHRKLLEWANTEGRSARERADFEDRAETLRQIVRRIREFDLTEDLSAPANAVAGSAPRRSGGFNSSEIEPLPFCDARLTVLCLHSADAFFAQPDWIDELNRAQSAGAGVASLLIFFPRAQDALLLPRASMLENHTRLIGVFTSSLAVVAPSCLLQQGDDSMASVRGWMPVASNLIPLPVEYARRLILLADALVSAAISAGGGHAEVDGVGVDIVWNTRGKSGQA